LSTAPLLVLASARSRPAQKVVLKIEVSHLWWPVVDHCPPASEGRLAPALIQINALRRRPF
jgi:hypothetical protein